MKKKLIIDPFNSIMTVTFNDVNFNNKHTNIVTATYTTSLIETSRGYGHLKILKNRSLFLSNKLLLSDQQEFRKS